MRLRKITIENVRSFSEKQTLQLDGAISIIIGPNGGGKTNLLDTIVISLRRYLQSPTYFALEPSPENPYRYALRTNDILNNMILEKHSSNNDKPQHIEIDVEVTDSDIQNMRIIKEDVPAMLPKLGSFSGHQLHAVENWNIGILSAGDIFTFSIKDGYLIPPAEENANTYFQFLHNFESISFLRTKLNLSELTLPIVYLPINRSANGFQSTVQLSGYNDVEQKRQSDASYSRQGYSLMSLAVGRLATKYRLLQEDDSGSAKSRLYADPSLIALSELLSTLGYGWELECINPLTNQYDIVLTKQGTRFNANAASSGERELLNYAFAIHVLKISDALIIVDEPELHLHPRWQVILLELFESLAKSTGNQFLLATHSPAFVSPQSIQYISRVYSRAQQSFIVRLNQQELPISKHLFNTINSQNNEKIFFADKVILVEGISDRIVFSALQKIAPKASSKVIEIVSIGGKGFFEAYKKILNACEVEYSIIADLDYIEQIGTQELKSLFKLNVSEIKSDVIDNIGSLDAATLVRALDKAIEGEGWGEAAGVWQYIKSRRRMLIPNLSEAQTETLQSFIEEQREKNIYVLSRGAIEQYLPIGHRKKDLEKLISLASTGNLWDQISVDGRSEMELIVQGIGK
jgi:ABC-type lipoprotein export system ATPase subunit